MKADAPVRIALADDHALVRAGFEALLSHASGMQVVGTAADGAELLALLAGTEADLVVTDLAMPGMGGFEAITRIRAGWPKVRVLVVSMDASADAARRALGAGGGGYLVKSAAPQELELAVRTVMAGGCYLSPAIASALVQPGPQACANDLSQRELEILKMVAEGKAAKQIGFTLAMSQRTVISHRLRIMEKLGQHDVAGLTRYALKLGLTS